MGVVVTMALKFAADAMLGKLAKWLRLLGYDVFYSPEVDDDTLVEIALREGRILLTRDTHLLRRRQLPPYLLILSDNWEEQLVQAVLKFNLNMDSHRMTRCVECNVPLETVSKDEVRYDVPRYVYRTHEHFARCPQCGKVYWAGSHYQRANDTIERLKMQVERIRVERQRATRIQCNM